MPESTASDTCWGRANLTRKSFLLELFHAREDVVLRRCAAMAMTCAAQSTSQGVSFLVVHARTLPEGEADEWGHELIADGHAKEAIAVLKLVTAAYPESGGSYDSLGDAYAAANNNQLAIESYRKAIATHFEEAGVTQDKLDKLEKGKASAQ